MKHQESLEEAQNELWDTLFGDDGIGEKDLAVIDRKTGSEEHTNDLILSLFVQLVKAGRLRVSANYYSAQDAAVDPTQETLFVVAGEDYWGTILSADGELPLQEEMNLYLYLSFKREQE